MNDSFAADSISSAPSPAAPRTSAGPSPEGASSWLAVTSIAVAAFTTVTTEFLPVGLLTDIASSLNVSEGVAGLMVTTPGAIATIAAPALIVAAGKLDRKIALTSLTALLFIANLIVCFAPNFPTLLVGRLLLGVCVGGFWTFAPGAGAQLVGPQSQARAVSLILAGISVGTVAGVPAGSLVGGLYGWRAAFGTTAAVTLVLLIAQLALLPKLPPSRAITARDLLKPFSLPMARLGLVAIVLVIGGHFTAYTYLKPMLEHVFELQPSKVTILLLVYGVIGLVGNFAGAALVTRSIRLLLGGSAALFGVALLAATSVGTGLLASIVIVAIWGLAIGAIPLALTEWMLKAVPKAPEAGQALLVCVFQVSLASGALTGGRVVDNFGVPSAMIVGGSLALLAALIVVVLGRRIDQPASA